MLTDDKSDIKEKVKTMESLLVDSIVDDIEKSNTLQDAKAHTIQLESIDKFQSVNAKTMPLNGNMLKLPLSNATENDDQDDEVASNSSASLTDASENYDFLSAMLPILRQQDEPQEKGPATLKMIKKASSISISRSATIQIGQNVNADL